MSFVSFVVPSLLWLRPPIRPCHPRSCAANFCLIRVIRSIRGFFLLLGSGFAGLSIFAATFAPNCHAASGIEFKLPAGAKYPSGLTMQVDARGIDANGYRPVRITVSAFPANKPHKYDRQLRIVLHTGRVGSWRDRRVSQIIELPEGSTNTEATILVPQQGIWTSLAIDTYEGGEKLLDLSQADLNWATPSSWNWDESKPAFLFLDYNVPPRGEKLGLTQAFETTQQDASPTQLLPDVRALMRLYPEEENQRPGTGRNRGNRAAAAAQAALSDIALLTVVGNSTRSVMSSPQELPQRWLEISQFDVATISLADLKRLHSTQPQQFAALHDWLSTGPLLMVYGAGDNFAKLAEIEKLFDLPTLEPAGDTSSFTRGWTVPSPESFAAAQQSPLNDSPQPADPSLEESAPKVVQPPQTPPFLYRRASTGCVSAISAENPFPGKSLDWNWMFRAIPENHWQWSRRTGISFTHGNGDYWKFLVPGVGRAPVKTFLVLVSVFAALIGPLNYFLLARSRKLYLLLITVPLGAVLVTASLFGFALIADGISTRVRIRSYAELDQQTGRASVLSWQSYYAAVAPSSGLRIPEDTAVFPFLPDPNASSSDRSTLLVWDKDQVLRSGYLPSRSPTQFVAARATKTQSRLIVKQDQAAASVPSVENRLGAKIQQLLLRDTSGRYFSAQNIPNEAQRELILTELAATQTSMQSLAVAVMPMEPDGYDPTYQNDNIMSVFGIRRWRYSNSNLGSGEMAFSLLETNLVPAVRPTTEPHPLLPGSYFAILDRSPLVITGVQPTTEQQSLHLLRGRY